ncbi:hypothetical protein [Microbacterium sp. CJ77]|uniref:hypothetical protein n=1 Tax=Microbacterium sp. CJ77 TaxID=2079201 RepID=UPI000CD8E49E|nr:hypothetical protein [Microbacterium sp. CJ77]
MTARWRAVARATVLVGVVMMGVPLVAPMILAAVGLVTTGGFHFDWLIPGELSVVTIVGGLCVFTASLLLRRMVLIVGLLLGVIALLLAGVTWLPTLTGVGQGAGGVLGIVVVACYVLYVVATIGLLAVAIALARASFTAGVQTTE